METNTANSSTPVEVQPPAFRPPDQVATDDEPVHLPVPSQSTRPVKARWYRRIRLPTTRQGKIKLASGLVLLIVLVVAGWLVLQPKAKSSAVVKSPDLKAKLPVLVPSTLTGLPVSPMANQRPVTAVMVENTPQARPQSGLSQAGVVFEALAEGGISRFMAIYQDSQPNSIGPIRSARPYYIEWALGFDAAYSHVGGSSDALADISSWGVKDLDESSNGSYYHRVSSRAAPHNVYTSMAALNTLETAKGYTSSDYQGFDRQKITPAKVPSVTTVSLDLSGPDYNPTYAYNQATNSYDRSESGSPLIDAGNNQRVSPTVVIAIVVPLSRGALDTSGAYYSDYAAIGSGPAYIFQNGSLITGQWTKPTNTDQIKFEDVNGQSIPLQPGQTWITAVATSSDVQYTK